MLRMNFPSRKEQRQKEAIERQDHCKSLSNVDKIAELNKRLGKGKGAKLQRANFINNSTKLFY